MRFAFCGGEEEEERLGECFWKGLSALWYDCSAMCRFVILYSSTIS